MRGTETEGVVSALFSRCVIELEQGIKPCCKKDLVKQNGGHLFPFLLLTISNSLFRSNRPPYQKCENAYSHIFIECPAFVKSHGELSDCRMYLLSLLYNMTLEKKMRLFNMSIVPSGQKWRSNLLNSLASHFFHI